MLYPRLKMKSDDKDPMDWEEWNGELPFWQHAVCGSTAGVIEHISLFPLDTIKTRLQTELCKCASGSGICNVVKPELSQGRHSIVNMSGISRLASISGWLRTSPVNRITMPMYTDIATQYLARASTKTRSNVSGNLFRGSNVIVIGCVPAHILYFTVYESVKRTNVALSGAMATLCHDFILTPADVIKQRLQLGCYKGTLDCMHSVIKYEGVKALFRSFSVTLFMNVPYHALLVSVMQFLRDRGGEGKINHFVYAGIGGAVAGALTTPFDVIKTRLQTQTCYLPSKPKQFTPQYKNVLGTAKNIIVKEGFKGFFRGATTRVGICTPAAAISWGTYESLKQFFKLWS